ncbi:hypothetical protein FNH22_25535 [Fulvivirga sp. M361]|uniref:hypothetical protein n=1 Tax=Fulvivirga sp. M361 TaxID=2594266 RepID=UPI00117BC3F8|nr:hypothetical protein [Fulvivirga sp. M361]TRX50407.1 hypothetical protein FNH22_25535 [Fulvivirga sp. M361]
MKITRKVLSMIAIAAMLVFSACGDDDDDNGGGMLNKDGTIASQEDDDLDKDDLKGNVTADITLNAATEWTLTGPLAVKSGATLTIEAGTTIKAQAGGTNVYIVIETGAKINAAGTATNPIIITSAATNPRAGDWGGLLVNGLAPISGGGTSTTEVLPLSYGGTAADDDSGTITYMTLEYTGARINGEKEFNGFTFYAVGSGTTINNIAVNFGDDDGIEWFGGTVDVDNALVVNARDDMFDWTQGYVGTITNAYGIRKEGFTAISEDVRGIEADGNLDGNSPDQAGQSDVVVTNLTLINEEPLINVADWIKIRRGSKATITNAYVTDVSKASDFIDFSDRKGMATDDTTVSGNGIGKDDGEVDTNDVKTEADFDDPADGIQADEMTDASFTLDESATGVAASVFSWTGLL